MLRDFTISLRETEFILQLLELPGLYIVGIGQPVPDGKVDLTTNCFFPRSFYLRQEQVYSHMNSGVLVEEMNSE